MALPKTLFIYEEKDGDGTSYFVACKVEEDCAEMREKRIVGKYNLEKKEVVEGVASVKIYKS